MIGSPTGIPSIPHRHCQTNVCLLRVSTFPPAPFDVSSCEANKRLFGKIRAAIFPLAKQTNVCLTESCADCCASTFVHRCCLIDRSRCEAKQIKMTEIVSPSFFAAHDIGIRDTIAWHWITEGCRMAFCKVDCASCNELRSAFSSSHRQNTKGRQSMSSAVYKQKFLRYVAHCTCHNAPWHVAMMHDNYRNDTYNIS